MWEPGRGSPSSPAVTEGARSDHRRELFLIMVYGFVRAMRKRGAELAGRGCPAGPTEATHAAG
jgi:hypothetical protein